MDPTLLTSAQPSLSTLSCLVLEKVTTHLIMDKKKGGGKKEERYVPGAEPKEVKKGSRRKKATKDEPSEAGPSVHLSSLAMGAELDSPSQVFERSTSNFCSTRSWTGPIRPKPTVSVFSHKEITICFCSP